MTTHIIMFIQPGWNKYIHKQKGMLHKYLLLRISGIRCARFLEDFCIDNSIIYYK